MDLKLFLELVLRVAFFFLLVRVLRTLLVRKVLYLVVGTGKMLVLEDVSISVFLEKIKPHSATFDVEFSRGSGRWTNSEKFEIVTEEHVRFLIFPTPNFPFQGHEIRVYGKREGDKVLLDVEKKGGWKDTFFGGPGFT